MVKTRVVGHGVIFMNVSDWSTNVSEADVTAQVSSDMHPSPV